MKSLLTLIMAGGRGERLRPLTDRLAKPAVPFGNRSLVDYTLENCARSRLFRVAVLTQYLSRTVEAHVESHWQDRIGLLSTFSAEKAGRPFRGTADAVRAALAAYGPARRVLVLAADHVYSMDYRKLLAFQRNTNAAVAISAALVRREAASGFGVIDADERFWVRDFHEKPKDPPPAQGYGGHALASMGIYAFDGEALVRHLVEHPEAVDFGHQVLPGMLQEGRRIAAYLYGAAPGEASWRDIADVDAYWRAHMDLHACNREGSTWRARRSFIGHGVRLGPDARLEESVVQEGAILGAGCRLRRVVVEAGALVPSGTVAGYDREADETLRTVTPGGIVVFSGGPRLVPARRKAESVA